MKKHFEILKLVFAFTTILFIGNAQKPIIHNWKFQKYFIKKT